MDQHSFLENMIYVLVVLLSAGDLAIEHGDFP